MTNGRIYSPAYTPYLAPGEFNNDLMTRNRVVKTKRKRSEWRRIVIIANSKTDIFVYCQCAVLARVG